MTDRSENRTREGKSDQAFRTISEVAEELDLPQHVLRFWETKFHQISPMKRGGGRRYYRPEDVSLLERIKGLLHQDGYTIKGVQKLLNAGFNNLPEPSTPEPEEPVSPAPVSAPEPTEQLAELPMEDVLALVGELEDIRDGLKKYIS
ncbi:MerR family transcriptional regulator [Magnetovibrio sp. PR-2]|uniref:MerR family transcriptional regulator n=1 Tax=Magnetovibrio sp. PR-2 TaxID=3120356 RepID=UPI002FCE32F5